MGDFDLFRTNEEHEELRAAVRSVAEDKIAPHAAEVDEKSAFPQDALDALVATDFHAAHIAEDYEGVGADALATCIIIEEVARVCASSSLIPAVNKLGTMPVILGGSEEVKQRYLTPVARGEAMFSYGLSEREAGSDTASMRSLATPKGDDWVLNGQKSWITNAGVSEYYTVLAVTDPEGKRGRNISAFVVHADDPGFTLGEPERKLGIKGSPTRELFFDDVHIPATGSSAPRARASRSPCAPWTTRASPSARRPSASPRAPWTTPWPTSRSASSSVRPSPTSRASSSCWPTWP